MSIDPAALEIVAYPDPVLKRPADPVAPADEIVRAVARRMIELMHEADGVGLAAPQVGLSWRLFVTNAREVEPEDRVFMNPKLTLGRGPVESVEEGCLSLPGIRVQVRRPLDAVIEAIGIDGESVSMSASGFLARVWQHEYDHLDGTLIIDRMSPMDRLATRKAIKELIAGSQLTS